MKESVSAKDYGNLLWQPFTPQPQTSEGITISMACA